MTFIKKTTTLALTLITAGSIFPMTSMAATYSNEWVQKDGKWYYYDYYGKKVKSNYAYDSNSGIYYVVDSTGARVEKKGWYTLKQKNITTYGDKFYVTMKFYLKKGGAVTTGWKTLSGKEYYFYSSGEMAKSTSISKSDDKYYFLGSDGAMVKKKGWVEAKGSITSSFDGTKYTYHSWYYLKKTGEVTTGWKTIKGKRYFFYSSGSMAVNTYVSEYKDGKYVYYAFGKDGAQLTSKGLKTIKYTNTSSNKLMTTKETSVLKVYVKSDGTLHTGLKTIKGKKYYFDPEMILCNYRDVKGVRYYFGKKGTCTKTEKLAT